VKGPLIPPRPPDKSKKMIKNRTAVMLVFTVLVFCVFAARLVQIQIIDTEKYRRQSERQLATPSPVKASRGEILDRYGRPLVVNRDGYNIVFDKAYISNENLNIIIDNLTKVLVKNGDEWRDRTPLAREGEAAFDESGSYKPKQMIRKLDLNEYATADDCVFAMTKKFGLEFFDETAARKIMGVRFTMLAEDFSLSLPYTFAENISEETRAYIKENSFNFAGVSVQNVPMRFASAPEIAPHIIGTTGPIYAEDWDELKEKGYLLSDYVGKSGIEKAFETYLRGENGKREIITDKNGKIVGKLVAATTMINNISLQTNNMPIFP